jgi:hypothetical protein
VERVSGCLLRIFGLSSGFPQWYHSGVIRNASMPQE